MTDATIKMSLNTAAALIDDDESFYTPSLLKTCGCDLCEAMIEGAYGAPMLSTPAQVMDQVKRQRRAIKQHVQSHDPPLALAVGPRGISLINASENHGTTIHARPPIGKPVGIFVSAVLGTLLLLLGVFPTARLIVLWLWYHAQ